MLLVRSLSALGRTQLRHAAAARLTTRSRSTWSIGRSTHISAAASAANIAEGRPIVVNGRSYALPVCPIVGICLDGSAHEYIDAAMSAGRMPALKGILGRGSSAGVIGSATCVTPTYTNPNNVAIVTGAPPAVNGICGNYFFDTEKQREVMMNDPQYLRCGTLFETLNAAGVPVVVITAKDKLLRLLSHGCEDSPSFLGFSVEKAEDEKASQQLQRHGFQNIHELMQAPPPHIYDPDASVYCVEAGAQVLKTLGTSPSVLYLSTTDYVQHKHQPDDEEAIAFYAKLDKAIGVLDSLGAIIGITADHGMNNKTLDDGSPDVCYLETLLAEQGIASRVILPITDPYVVHHGALGGYATIYLENKAQMDTAMELLRSLSGLDYVQPADFACQEFLLPMDRVGDIIVTGTKSSVIGRTKEFHDLTDVPRLRSHGSLFEAQVPMIFNRPLTTMAGERLRSGSLRNYDLFDILLNGVIP